MQKVSKSHVRAALAQVGVSSGDHLIVHSDIMKAGFPENGVATYVDALMELIGENGTICVPTFSFSFISSGQYHYNNTKSEAMGVLAESIRTSPNSMRSRHPLQSVAAVGAYANALCQIDSASAYAGDGQFALMCKLGFKVLILGCDPAFISLSHLAEESQKVPYRFMKRVTGQAELGESEEVVERSWQFYARYLQVPITPGREEEIVMEMAQDGEWHTGKLNGAVLGCGSAENFVSRYEKKLQVDPYWPLPDREKRCAKEFCAQQS